MHAGGEVQQRRVFGGALQQLLRKLARPRQIASQLCQLSLDELGARVRRQDLAHPLPCGRGRRLIASAQLRQRERRERERMVRIERQDLLERRSRRGHVVAGQMKVAEQHPGVDVGRLGRRHCPHLVQRLRQGAARRHQACAQQQRFCMRRPLREDLVDAGARFGELAHRRLRRSDRDMEFGIGAGVGEPQLLVFVEHALELAAGEEHLRHQRNHAIRVEAGIAGLRQLDFGTDQVVAQIQHARQQVARLVRRRIDLQRVAQLDRRLVQLPLFEAFVGRRHQFGGGFFAAGGKQNRSSDDGRAQNHARAPLFAASRPPAMSINVQVGLRKGRIDVDGRTAAAAASRRCRVLVRCSRRSSRRARSCTAGSRTTRCPCRASWWS